MSKQNSFGKFRAAVRKQNKITGVKIRKRHRYIVWMGQSECVSSNKFILYLIIRNGIRNT